MARTPDRRPGILQEEEEIQFFANPVGPSTSGSFNFNGDDFVFRDSTGSFNPRGGGVFAVSGSYISSAYTASFFSGLSGSLTQLADGTSYIISSPGITVVSSSNGPVTIGVDGNVVALTAGATFTGNIAVNGGDLTTTSTTFNLINTNANTVYFAGDATTLLNIGNPAGSNVIEGQTQFSQGLSGSLTKLADGSSYLIAGQNVTITSGSNGSVTISASTGAQDDFFDSTTVGSIFTTSSLALKGSEVGIDSPSDKGTDVFFYVSGSLDGSNKSLFGGGVAVSGSVVALTGFSGSLTKLADGTSFIQSGDYISVSSASNGSITVSGVGIAPVGSSFVTIGNDATLTNERSLTAGTGLILTDAGANSTVTLSINDSIVATVSGTTFTGATKHNAGLSGSLTQLVDGTSYIIAGSGISVASQSNGPITIANIAQYPPGGAQGQVQYYDSGNFAGSSQFTFSPSNGAVTASILVGTTISGSSVVSGSKVFAEVGEVNQYLRINGGVDISSIPTSTVDSAFLYVSGANSVLHFAHYDENENDVSITDIHSYDGLLQTGLRWGGFLSTAPGSTTFSITSGSGQVVRYNTSPGKEPEPFIKEVRWGNIVSQSLSFVASSQFTYVALDEDLNVLQQTVPYTLAGSGDVIFLGRVNHPSSTTINAVMFPETTYGQPAAFLDFARAFGPLKVSGHVLTPSGSSMRVKKSGGDSFIIGGNYLYNQDTPSYITSAEDQDKDAPLFVYSWVSGSTFLALTNAGAGYTVLDPNKYVSGSTLTTVPSGKFSNLRVYYQPRNLQGYLTVYYGNDYYDTLTDAVNGIDQESFTEHPTTQLATIFCGYVSAQSGSADLSDPAQAQIKQAGLFRTTAGISVAGGGGGGGGGTPGGLDTYVQYNQGGTVFAGDAQFTYNAVTNVLTVGNAMIGGTGELMGTGVTFDLLDTTVQTINFGGAATTIDLGSTGGTNNLFGATKMPQGLSGSLTRLTDGSSYLISSGNISITSASNGAVTIGTTAINSTEHTTLRQLIHLTEEGGPFEGFTLGSYRESLPTGDPFPTSVIWWETSAKLKKIVEETVTYNSQKLITTDQWKVYNTDGVTVAKTATDTISYSGVFETNRTRTIT